MGLSAGLMALIDSERHPCTSGRGAFHHRITETQRRIQGLRFSMTLIVQRGFFARPAGRRGRLSGHV